MLGYLAFFTLLFTPGLAVALLLRQEQSGSVSLLARSYGLSLVINSLVGIGGLYLQISYATLSLTLLVASLLVVLVVLATRYKLQSFPALKADLRKSLPALSLGLIFGVLILSEFLKYPVFPKVLSADFIQHSQLVELLLAGSTSNSGWWILYGGVHANLAMGGSLVGGPTIVQLPILMALLTAPSSLVIYEAGIALYGTNRNALLTQALYMITGFVWYVPLYDSGLYPNLYGTILSLSYILLLLRFRASMDWRSYSLLLLTTLGLYLSHYSVVLFIAAITAYLLVRLALRKESLRFVGIVVVTSLAPAAVVFLRPDLLALASHILGYGGPSSTFLFSTPLADALSLSTFLRYLVAEIYSYVDVFLLLFTLPIALYYVWSNRDRSPALLLIAVWLGVLWITAPQGELTWRFSNEALAPLVVLAPASFEVLGRTFAGMMAIEKAGKGRKVGSRRRGHFVSNQAIAAIVILLIVFSGSWANAMLTDLSTDASVYANAQTDLYNSMIWFNQSTPAHSSLLSVTDWRIAFMQQLTGRPSTGLIFANSTQAVQYAEANHLGYILVTYLIPADVPLGFDAVSYYNSFSNDPNLRQVYSNPTDVIYQVVG